MQSQFQDRVLICSDCHGEFIFTAGEQLFFHDKQFKNDPKRCKPCKARRSGLAAAANGATATPVGLARTETRTICSECGIETTVPFKPTQGRPVLCRQCFGNKGRAAASTPAGPAVPQTSSAAFAPASVPVTLVDDTLSPQAVMLAAASISASPPNSSVASAADLASILEPSASLPEPALSSVLLGSTAPEAHSPELHAGVQLKA